MNAIPFGGQTIRNLLYYIWPTKRSEAWRWNVRQLVRHMDQFNGQRIVAVATDDNTVSVDEVRKEFQGTVRDFLTYRNDPSLGEAIAFVDLLKRVENIDPRQLTFYAHAKGVKYKPGEQPMVRLWSWAMYSNMLAYRSLVEDALQAHTICGTFFKEGNAFGTLPPSWHFAGTFFWLRNAYLFAKDSWNRCARQWWGTEAWPGVVCQPEEAVSMLMRGTAPTMRLYQKAYWKSMVAPIWNNWQIRQAALKNFSSYNEVIKALKGCQRVAVTGPQRSGTTIAAKMLAADLKIPFVSELDFDTYNHDGFMKLIEGRGVFQCPTMSAYAHLLPFPVVWMRRNLPDILRSQERITWGEFEQLEKDRYFYHGSESAAVVKTRAWESHQRITLAEHAFDLDYESLKGHRLWIDPEGRKKFGSRQTYPMGR